MKKDGEHSDWWLRVGEGNRAGLQFPHENADAVKIVIEEATTGRSFDIQLNRPRLKVKANHRYVVNFLARANRSRSFFVGFAKAHAPWSNLGLHSKIGVTPEWQSFEKPFVTTEDDDNGRIYFDAGASDISLEVSAVTLRSLSEGKFVQPSPPSSQETQIGLLVAESVLTDHDLPTMEPPPAGRLHKPLVPGRPSALRDTSLAQLTSELLARIKEGAFSLNEAAILLGSEINEALKDGLEVHNNRFSRRRYRDLFDVFYTSVQSLFPVLHGATIVDLGCGSINPYGLLFLFLLLGARRGVALDLDEIQDLPRAVRALADLSAKMLIDPQEVVRDYPITREQVLRNIASFDLARLRVGDPLGLDSTRLHYLRESVYKLSLTDGEADLVISNAFFEHLPHVEDAIVELARITRRGGLGIHIIDGSDHRRYDNRQCHPLEFLTETSTEPMLYGSNRIRPREFESLFNRHGFEVLSFIPFESVDVTPELRERCVEPFRSMPDEALTVPIAKLVVRRL